MKIDGIAHTYFISSLFEMAKNAGKFSYSRINSNEKYRSSMYPLTKDYPEHTKISDNVSLHKKEDENSTHYATLNHDTKEILHHAIVKKNRPSEGIPFEHEEQTIVDRIKNQNDIPKGYATDVIYNHFRNSKFPLRSSGDQYLNGHKMWHRLVDMALEDGHGVYYYDENTKEHTPITKENKNEYLEKSFGDSDDFEHKHIILRKNKHAFPMRIRPDGISPGVKNKPQINESTEEPQITIPQSMLTQQ